MAQATVARLHLIGSPFVRLGEERLALPTRKLLAVLAILALDGATDRARLAELLWSGLDVDARGSLRRELYRLRGTPAASLVLEEGQTLKLVGVSSDLHDFQRAIETKNWLEAEQLGRGTLLNGLHFDSPEFDEWLEFHRAVFDEQYRLVLWQRATALEFDGLPFEALEVFERLWRLDALNEEAVRGILRVLETLGDNTRLLSVYKQFSDQLEFELGIQPARETQSLAAKARGERLEPAVMVAIASSPVEQKQLRSSGTTLFGRERAWAQLEEAWQTGKVIFIAGEPGMGKSRLMLEFAASKVSLDQQVLTVHRHGDAQTPLLGMTRLMRAVMNNQSPDLLPDWVCLELAHLLPELGEPSSKLQDKTRMLTALSEFMKIFGQHLRLSLGDDNQFMDAATWELGRNLTLNPGQTVRTIMAYRKNELPESLQTDVNALLEAEQAMLIELEGLEINAVQALVQQYNPQIQPDQLESLSQKLHAFTGGNPLFVLETLKAIGTEFNNELPRVQKVREVILARLERLSKPAKDLVRVAAITPEFFSLELASLVLQTEALELSDAIFELERAGIMTDGKFSHDSLYETALESIPKPAKVLLHNRVLGVLETQKRLRGTASLYLQHALAAQNPSKILEYSVLAASEANERFAYPEALAHYDRALALETEAAKSFELYWQQSRIYRIQGQRDAWAKTVEGMLWQAAQSLDPELEARAALGEIELLLERGEHKNALEHAEHLLERPGLSHNQRGATLVFAADALEFLERIPEAQRYLLAAEPLIAVENYALIAQLQAGLRNIASQGNDLAEARRRNALALEAYRRAGNRSGEIAARLSAAALASRAGDADAAQLNYQVAIERAQESGNMPLQRYAILGRLDLYLAEYDALNAQIWVENGLKCSLEPPDLMYEGMFHERQASVYGIEGKLALMLKASQSALECYQRLNLVHYQAERFEWFAHRLIELGQYQNAFEYIELGKQFAQQQQLALEAERFLLAQARHCLFNNDPKQAIDILEPLLIDAKTPAISQFFPPRVTLGQAYIQTGRLEQAFIVLNQAEDHETREIFRLASLLNLEIEQNKPQNQTLEKAKKLLAQNLAPNYTIELWCSLARALWAANLPEEAEHAIGQAFNIQEQLCSSLAPEQQPAFLSRMKTLLGRHSLDV